MAYTMDAATVAQLNVEYREMVAERDAQVALHLAEGAMVAVLAREQAWYLYTGHEDVPQALADDISAAEDALSAAREVWDAIEGAVWLRSQEVCYCAQCD